MGKPMTEQTAQEKPNQGFLASYSFDDADLETMIEVDHVSMIFNMASEQLHSLKEYAISLARRELSFKEFRALNDISLTVKRGDVFGIMGTNGSGKSTLLKIIAGVLDPSEGTCSINGSIAPLIELGAGFDLELTARENIYLNGALLGYSKEFINEHFDEIVNFAEIRPFLDMPMKNYSSGMVARVAFAIATVIVPDILIVDEVLSVGDFMFQQKCERRIQSLIRDYGVTVLIVSHNSDQIERLCNKAIWIEKGHTRMIGTATDVCRVYRILGGRSGSAESERILFGLFEQIAAEGSDARIENISGRSRYELSSRIYALDDAERNMLVISYGADFIASILAAGFANVEDADILSVDEGSLSGALEQAIQERNYERTVVVFGEEQPSEKLLERIRALLPNASFEQIGTHKPSELSCALFERARTDDASWARTALVCAPHNRTDLMAISPYLFAKDIPLFFIDEAGTIPKKTLDALNTFDSIILLGGMISFPESSLTSIDSQIETTRLYGDDPYDAYLKIKAWIDEQSAAARSEERRYFIASLTDIDKVPFAGLLASRKSGELLLYSDQDANSIATIVKDIQAQKLRAENLCALGLESSLNDASVALFSQAVRPSEPSPLPTGDEDV